MIYINNIKGNGTITSIYWTPPPATTTESRAILGRGWRDNVDVVTVERGPFWLLAEASAVREEIVCFKRDNNGGFPALESAIIRAAFAADPPTPELLARIAREISAVGRDGERAGGLEAQRVIRRSLGIDD